MKRRMIATEIVSEGRFLRMSLTAQALYMHLLANADDDGCVDAYTITRMIGAKEDDLVLLKEREYITVLDEKEYILWITGWQDFNWIDARYKEDSKYLPLLRAKVEGLEIVESSKKEYNQRRYQKRVMEKKASAHVQPMGNPREDTGGTLLRKGKERLGEITTLQAEAKPRQAFIDSIKSDDVRMLWNQWELAFSEITTSLEENRAALGKLLELDGFEKSVRLINLAARAWSEKYTPKEAKASSPKELWKKRSTLLAWGKGKFTQQQTTKLDVIS